MVAVFVRGHTPAELQAAIDAAGGSGGYVYETIAELQAATVPASVDVVTVQGYYAPGDGGGHQRYRTASAGSSGVTVQSANGVWWKPPLYENGGLNVRWVGAKGDGVTDDRARIVAAYTYLSNSRTIPSGSPQFAAFGLGRLYFPKGRYFISAPIEFVSALGIIFEGDGETATMIETNISVDYLFRFSILIYVHIWNMAFVNYAASPADTCAIELDGAGGGTRCTFKQLTQRGFYSFFDIVDVVNNDNFLFERVEFRGPVGYRSWNNQAIGNTFIQCDNYTTEALFDMYTGGDLFFYGGSSIATGCLVRTHTGNGGQADRIIFRDMKIEYQGAPAPGENPTFHLIDGTDGGFACVIFDEVNIDGGDVPINPDTYVMIKGLNHGAWQVIQRGGFIRGAIEFGSSGDHAASNLDRPWLFTDTTRCPLPRNVTLTGTGHPLIQWRNCRRVPDNVLGGARNLTNPLPKATYPWRYQTEYIAFTNTGFMDDSLDSRVGQDFTIDLGAPCWLTGMREDCKSVVGTGTTEYTVYTDATFTVELVATQAITSTARTLSDITTGTKWLTDGKLYLRITRAAINHNVRGALLIDYQPSVAQ